MILWARFLMCFVSFVEPVAGTRFYGVLRELS
jgi:hypothetical protein